MPFTEEQIARFENNIRSHKKDHDKDESWESLPDPDDYVFEVFKHPTLQASNFTIYLRIYAQSV